MIICINVCSAASTLPRHYKRGISRRFVLPAASSALGSMRHIVRLGQVFGSRSFEGPPSFAPTLVVSILPSRCLALWPSTSMRCTARAAAVALVSAGLRGQARSLPLLAAWALPDRGVLQMDSSALCLRGFFIFFFFAVALRHDD